MPYSDPEEQKAYRREWYRNRLEKDKEFRKKEKERKSEWFSESEKAHEKVRDYQRKNFGRPNRVEVSLSDDELAELREEAKRLGIQVRTLIRMKLFDE